MIAHSDSSVVAIGSLASALGVSEQTVRNWCEAGKIPSFRSAGGHRRFNVHEVLASLGIKQEESSITQGKVFIYVRVSSKTQASQGSLDRQRTRLLEAVAERENVKQEEIEVIEDIASAFGNRRGLNLLIDHVLAGHANKIFVEYQDRLSRVPALTRLLQHLCSKRGVQIIALDREEDNPNELQAAMLELVEFTTVLSNRINGRKSKGRERVKIDDRVLGRAYHLRLQGYGHKAIADALTKKGYRDQNGEPFTRGFIRRRLKRDWETLEEQFGKQVENSLNEFIKEHVRTTRVTTDQCYRLELIRCYRHWCRIRKKRPLELTYLLGKAAKKNEWGFHSSFKNGGYRRIYTGLKIRYSGPLRKLRYKSN